MYFPEYIFGSVHYKSVILRHKKWRNVMIDSLALLINGQWFVWAEA